VLISFAVSWLGVAMGMQSKTVETASNLPFTPFIEAVRGLLLGTPLGWNPALAVGWSVVIGLGGYVWSTAIYERKSVR
jgi:ABC-2 type transport system permease protein